MSLSAYSNYKDSNVAWFGQIPSHWSVIRVKALMGNSSDVVQTGPFGAQLHSGDYVEEGTPLILIRNVNNLRIDISDIPRVSFEDAERLSMYKLEVGDIVFSRVGSIGRIALVTKREEGWLISGQMLRMRIRNPDLDSGFAIYGLSSEVTLQAVQLESVGSTRDSINTDILRNLPIPLPPLPEQRAIAAFLDAETARIDDLVAKQEALIATLQEKRRALISHAVTKGLDPAAPMKDSGVPWLGEVPAHWDVVPLKRRWEIVDCKHITATYVDNGIPILSTTEVKPGRLSLLDTRMTTEEDYLFLTEGRKPKRGDIIYSRNASVGSAAYVDTDERFCMGQDVCLITSLGQDQLFLSYQLNSPVGLSQIDALMIGSTIKRVNVGQIRELTLACPPVSEQREIAVYLDDETTQIDTLIAKAHELIGLLREHRTALIAAAVTGQIDVRGWVG